MNQYYDTTLNHRDRRVYFLMFFCELGVLRGDRCDRPLLNQQVRPTSSPLSARGCAFRRGERVPVTHKRLTGDRGWRIW